MIDGLKIENKKRNKEFLFEMKVLVIYVQINQLSIFYAALFKGSGCAGIGVAIRDLSGVIIASLS